ncbi:MAG: glycosyltransferase family 39 protein [Solirubrobacteraceae bacterium]
MSARRALIVIMVLAAALRLPTLALQSYWYDEAATVVVVKGSLGHLVHVLPDMEGNPPLYYVLAWGWSHIFGHGEVALRSLSALAGLGLVPVSFALGRRLSGQTRAGLAAALLVACAPFLVWFSQEARAYSLMALLVALALLFLLERRVRLWALLSVLALATHYFAALFVLPMALLVLREHRRRALVPLAALALAAAALAPLAIHQHDHARRSIVGSFATRAAQLPKQLLVGYHAPADRPLAVATGLLALLGLLWALRTPSARRVLGLCAGSLAMVGMLALAGLDYLDSRNMIFLLTPLAAVLGVGLGSRPALIAALCAAGIAGVLIVDLNVSAQRDDWRGALRALSPSRRPRAIVVTPGQGYLPVLVYRAHARLQLLARPVVREIDVIGMAERATGNAPSPPPPGSVPAGFHAALVRRTPLYTVERFVTTTPLQVPASALAAAHLGPKPPVVFLER